MDDRPSGTTLAVHLEATVARFNRAALEGVDPDFRRGESLYDHFYGDPDHKPNPNLGTIEKGPFYAIQVHPGAIGTNFARNFDPAFVSNFLQAAGVDIEVKRGERLPDEVMETLQPRVRQLMSSPQDVANAVLFAVTQSIWVNISELTLRPPKQLAL